MADTTQITWTDRTQNWWIGCTKVSPACTDCYAARETFVRRERSHGRELWGPKADRHRTAEAYWNKPYSWNEQNWVECSSCGWRGEFKETVFAGELRVCPSCFGSVHTTRQRVFVSSLSDICERHPQITEDMRAMIAQITMQCTNIDWLWLTKRPENYGPLWLNHFGGKFPDNVWLGTTVENQEYADKRIPELLNIPAKLRWLSIEPQVGYVDLFSAYTHYKPLVKVSDLAKDLHWVISGGESGPKARPTDPKWVRSMLEQCRSAGVPFHFKQWGEWSPDGDVVAENPGVVVYYTDGMSVPMYRVGKKSAGRMLDGVMYNEFPVLE